MSSTECCLHRSCISQLSGTAKNFGVNKAFKRGIRNVVKIRQAGHGCHKIYSRKSFKSSTFVIGETERFGANKVTLKDVGFSSSTIGWDRNSHFHFLVMLVFAMYDWIQVILCILPSQSFCDIKLSLKSVNLTWLYFWFLHLWRKILVNFCWYIFAQVRKVRPGLQIPKKRWAWGVNGDDQIDDDNI